MLTEMRSNSADVDLVVIESLESWAVYFDISFFEVWVNCFVSLWMALQKRGDQGPFDYFGLNKQVGVKDLSS